MTAGGKEPPEQAKPFVEHLADLRMTIIHSLVLLAVGIVVAAPLAPRILDAIKRPLARTGVDPDTFLRVIRVAGGVSITMRIVLWGGLVLSLPFIVLVIGRFIAPGLHAREKKAIRRSAGFAVACFAAGVGIGYFVTLPLAIRTIFRINAWLGIVSDFVELGDYVTFVLRLLLAFGLAFQMPVVVVILGRLGIVHSDQLCKSRRTVIVALLVVAMILTPPDPITQLLMALPLIGLYEICIAVIRFSERRAAGAES